MASLTNGWRHFLRLFGTFRRKKTRRQKQLILPTGIILGHRPFVGQLRDTFFVCWSWSKDLWRCCHVLTGNSCATFITINLITKTDRAHQVNAIGMLCHDYILSTVYSIYINLVLALLSHISTPRFLAATKQLYEWYFLSVCPSVRLSVRLSVCHTFLTMFPSSYHHEIFRSYHIGPG